MLPPHRADSGPGIILPRTAQAPAPARYESADLANSQSHQERVLVPVLDPPICAIPALC